MADATAAARATEETPRTDDAELESLRSRLRTTEQERDGARRQLQTEQSGRFAAQEQAIAAATEAQQTKLAEAKRGYAAALKRAHTSADEADQQKAYDEAAELHGGTWRRHTRPRRSGPARQIR